MCIDPVLFYLDVKDDQGLINFGSRMGAGHYQHNSGTHTWSQFRGVNNFDINGANFDKSVGKFSLFFNSFETRCWAFCELIQCVTPCKCLR